MKSIRYFFLLTTFLLASCIGTDIVEPKVSDPILNITSTIMTIEQGTSFPLEFIYFNEQGVKESITPSWVSSHPEIVEVDINGVITAISSGTATITASFNDVADDIVLEVTNETTSMNVLTANLSGLNNYNVAGTATLEVVDNQLKLFLKSDFASSNGPGLYLYLSNFSNSVSGGVEIGPLQQNTGAQEYNVPANVSLNTYNYIIIYCKPFGVPFGNGNFN